MKFVSPAAGYRLIVLPDDFEVTRGGQRRPLRGLRVEFINGQFDTEEAARRLQWSAEDKEQVEQAMLANDDFGRKGGYYLVDAQVEQVSQPILDEQVSTNEALRAVETQCAVTFQTPEGAVPCGNRTYGNTDYCKSHQRFAEKVPEKV